MNTRWISLIGYNCVLKNKRFAPHNIPSLYQYIFLAQTQLLRLLWEVRLTQRWIKTTKVCEETKETISVLLTRSPRPMNKNAFFLSFFVVA